MSQSHTDREMVTVAVQTNVVPTFDLSYPRDPEETDEEARERALELAGHDASIALSQTAHEYGWTEVDTQQRKDQIGTLVIDETANVNDIRAMIGMGLELVPGIELRSNQDGTYDILNVGCGDE